MSAVSPAEVRQMVERLKREVEILRAGAPASGVTTERLEKAAALLTRMAERMERMEATLKDAEEIMALTEYTPPRDPMLHDIAKDIGKQAGFGALMAATERAWRETMAEDTTGLSFVGSEFVAGPCRTTHDACLKKIRDTLAGGEHG